MRNLSAYSIDDKGLHQAHGDHSHSIAWTEMRGLRQSLFDGVLSIKGKFFHFTIDGESAETEKFLEKFFRAWEKNAPEAAKKNAFDFAFPNKSFAGILLTTC